MRKSYICVFCFLLAGLAGMNLEAQTFRAGAVFGVNASQINGDFIAGFDKLGLHMGLKVVNDLTERVSWTTELLYSERGSRAGSQFGDPFKISVNYVEIPVMIVLKDWLKDDFYKMWFEAGLSAGRIINDKVEATGGSAILEGLNQTDVSIIGGATIFSSENLGFTLRYTHSLNLLRDERKNPNLSRYRGYFITLRAVYLF